MGECVNGRECSGSASPRDVLHLKAFIRWIYGPATMDKTDQEEDEEDGAKKDYMETERPSYCYGGEEEVDKPEF